MSFLKDSDNLRRIPFHNIKEATKNFETIIGRGGYGPVYKGEISISGNLTSVAVKRLLNIDESGQGLKEFLTEINLLSRYKHPNLVSLVGFCDEGNEKILIYEYAEHGSFDNYLETTPCLLTWKQRIIICIDVARGLDYLHNRVGEHHRVIHRDIKSANILLFGDSRKAKIADLGLSKIGRLNENESYLITNPAGTLGYCDPVYLNTGVLTKKSDVFSFGVVLFEALCGRLCFMNVIGRQRQLVPLARHCYKEGKLNEIMDPVLKDSAVSVKEFSKIAYQCVNDDHEERPSMDVVLQKLEKVLQLHEHYEEAGYELQEFEDASEIQELMQALELYKLGDILKLEKDYAAIKAIHMIGGILPTYTTKEEIYTHLSSGILIDGGQLWFSIDENGKNQEMISAMKFMHPYPNKWDLMSGDSTYPPVTSIFELVGCIKVASKVNMKVKIRTQFLSSNVSYAAYLVCKHREYKSKFEGIHALKYKVNNQRQSYISYPQHYYDNDGWGMIELCQTNSLKRSVEFEVLLEEFHVFSLKNTDSVLILGILFLPIQKFDGEKIKKEEMENPPTYEIGIGWENRLPNDYEKFVYYSGREMEKKSQNYVISETKDEAYTILSTGVYIKTEYFVDVWFWITKTNGKKCFMLSLESIFIRVDDEKPILDHSNESRFPYVLEARSLQEIYMTFEITACLLSENTSYACYLVYKIPHGFENRPVYAETQRLNRGYRGGDSAYFYDNVVFYLSGSSQRTVLLGPDGTAEQYLAPSSTIVNKLPIAQFPNKRKDGWLEVRLCQFTTYDDPSIRNICPRWFCLDEDHDRFTKFPICHAGYDHDFTITLTCNFHRGKGGITIPDLSVQGVEFRPLQNHCAASEEN